MKNGSLKKILKSHKGTFCMRIPITHITQEEEVKVGIMEEETEEKVEVVAGLTHKKKTRKRRI